VRSNLACVTLACVIAVGCSRKPQELASQDPPSSSHAAARSSNVTLEPEHARVAPMIAPPPVTGADTIEPWNPRGIDWVPFDEGLARAKKEHKPVCLVVYTTWCEHCRNYSHIFSDPRMVLRAKAFVMVRVDADADEAIAKRYQSDGTYIPRTFFLDSAGVVDPTAHSDHPRYKHFFDELHADSLLEAMEDALAPHPSPH
jgi:thiol-disulfide isomerase/thioredoxin